ncbi:hypothetical protein [Pseudomonas sp. PSKL.D1]|uniref:hypothetical protein n=1 Tax=Pseudomonas sp. PSKL.D1 TaxID=3029060 RepID=UPI0023815A8E|nr:hypothetical protein [Pseudomonas sp. PSKL.D1]WDY58736.1 hypothetical protein PVV54_03630 [Pseudomonas sp. PSKL.D1]
MTTIHLAFLVCALIFTASGFATLAAIAFIAHRKIDYIESFLPNCDMVTGKRKIWLHAGLIGKVIRLTNISFILLSPRLYTRKNLINLYEINNLPSKIKALLITIGVVILTLIAALSALGIFAHYLPPLPT